MGFATFHPAVRRWFSGAFDAPTGVQERAWAAIAARRDAVISAPTGSGKTLAGFLAVIDRLVKQALAGGLADRTYVLYVSPLKALSNDIQKNLEAPLAGIGRELVADGFGEAPIRALVRTGDTPQSERARMRKRPPHILVTTPESLYILLTSDSGRRMLSGVETVIIDEVHAVAGNKRGAHLSLSLERLASLCERAPVRVGISATVRPIEAVAEFLTGSPDAPCEIIDAGHQRERDLALELPRAPLEAIMANEVWIEIYDRLAELIAGHKTTLVFVNTRRLAERAARHLADRIGEDLVTSHHGSLAKEHRLNAETKLKNGQLKALVATSSLELGIDIGDVDLVCQLGSPHAIAALLQRVGRSGHGLRQLPKGRLFPLSRDELVECVALLDSVARGELDRIELCRAPLDVLAQQIVAEAGMRDWAVDDLLAMVKRSASYANLDGETFARLVDTLADGYSTQRGRRAAHLHVDRVNGRIRGRRGARLTAITNGGAIPDQFDFEVVLLPNEFPIGTVNEDFATESLAGDIFQLGNMSYRILKVRTGKVYVEDAKGQPPSIPFWLGEAPGRSNELSLSVSNVRKRVADVVSAEPLEQARRTIAAEFGLTESAAAQLVDYLAAGLAALGELPGAETIVLERFFDEAGDAHLVVHSTHGSRVNRAWGLALRKRFCRRFNFELQAAALEDSIVLSLGAVHSFALDEVTGYLKSGTVRGVVEQAVLGAPLFPTHWRWNATIALAVRRFSDGRKRPPQFQRIDAEDLLATAFPDQLACAENLPGGDIAIPEHPLVTQTLADCLDGVMDTDGLARLLGRIESGDIRVLCRDLASPSPLAQEILGAKPYAFLDDAPAEERRTLAVSARRYMSVDEARELGRLDAEAIERVRREAWPDVRNADELHDALVVIGFATDEEMSAADGDGRLPWSAFAGELERDGRLSRFTLSDGRVLWVAAERLGELGAALPEGRPAPGALVVGESPSDPGDALRELVRGRLDALGPVTAERLAEPLGLGRNPIDATLAALEQRGVAMRGAFTGAATEEWCERRLLARIHRYTLKTLRREIEPVSLADFQRFLFQWQGLGEHRREGPDALRAVVGELQGLTLPAGVWEREVLPARLVDYAPYLLDEMSRSGEIVWWRPGSATVSPSSNTVAASPIGIVPRSSFRFWAALAAGRDAADSMPALSAPAERVFAVLEREGASFFVDVVQRSGLLRVQVEDALGELVAAGLVTADAFHGLRALLTPQRRRPRFHGRGRHRGLSGSGFDAAGRWSLLPAADASNDRAETVAAAAEALLKRYGVVARSVLMRETLAPPWRELLVPLRRWEARGEIRGGRFVDALGGEQFAVTEALEALRRVRKLGPAGDWISISAADPLNLNGIVASQKRIAAIASHRLVYRDGIAVATRAGAEIEFHCELSTAERDRATSMALPRDASRQPRRVPLAIHDGGRE